MSVATATFLAAIAALAFASALAWGATSDLASRERSVTSPVRRKRRPF